MNVRRELQEERIYKNVIKVLIYLYNIYIGVF